MYISYSTNHPIIGAQVCNMYTERQDAPIIFINLLRTVIFVNSRKNSTEEMIKSGLLYPSHLAELFENINIATIGNNDIV